jgi:hypothetical protein
MPTGCISAAVPEDGVPSKANLPIRKEHWAQMRITAGTARASLSIRVEIETEPFTFWMFLRRWFPFRHSGACEVLGDA